MIDRRRRWFVLAAIGTLLSVVVFGWWRTATGQTRQENRTAISVREGSQPGSFAGLTSEFRVSPAKRSRIAAASVFDPALVISWVRNYGTTALSFVLAFLLWEVGVVRRARQAAERANQAKSEFLANMSHELRTPLNGIVAMTELLATSNLTPAQHEMISVVLKSSAELTTIVNDLLDFSTMEAGRLQLDEEPFCPGEAACECVRLFTPRAESKRLTISCRVDSSLPEVILGDPLRYRQVILNLLSNAIKFTDHGGVRVEVMAAGDALNPAALVRVVDTGIGIAPHVSKKLFRAFSQADTGSTRRFGGTGLGLAISLRLITMMGGSIGFESEPGRGSTFWFSAPIQPITGSLQPPKSLGPMSAVPDLPHPSNGAQPCPARVLVVEDNPVNQLVVTRMLQSLGYRADVAAGGKEALATLADGLYGLVLMDCQMPGMDGYTATTEIRRREQGKRRIPIVALTANTIAGDRERCLAAGMDDYLAKPLHLAALEAALKRHMRAPALIEV